MFHFATFFRLFTLIWQGKQNEDFSKGGGRNFWTKLTSPGHGIFLLQSWVSIDLPGQFFPPYCAAGELHSRFRVWVPCLQVLLHSLHLVHFPQFPSTKKQKINGIVPQRDELRIFFLWCIESDSNISVS